jgi:hypothetical protein
MKKSILYGILLFCLVELSVLILITGSATKGTNFSAEQINYENSQPYNFQNGSSHLHLPKADYIKNRSFENIFNIPREIEQLIIPSSENDIEVEDAFVHMLTIDLFSMDSSQYQLTNPNLFLHRIQWAEKMKTLSLSEHKRSVFFEMVYTYWFQKLADQLQVISRTQDDVKFNTDFNYLAHRLSENKYPVSYEISDTEKLFMNVHLGKYGYLWMKFTNKSVPFLITILSIAIVNLILIVIAIRSIISKKQPL